MTFHTLQRLAVLLNTHATNPWLVLIAGLVPFGLAILSWEVRQEWMQ